MVSMPSWAKGIVIAELMERDNDPYADYPTSSAVKTVYLSFSKHTRKLFPEMRKACQGVEGLEKFVECDKTWEQRRIHYFLAENTLDGWHVSKMVIPANKSSFMEELYIAAAEGWYFCQKQPKTQQSNTFQSEGLFTFAQTVHAKKGHALHVVQLNERVERDTFTQLKAKAKECDGYYSSYSIHGAIPGFQFRELAQAKAFAEMAEGVLKEG